MEDDTIYIRVGPGIPTSHEKVFQMKRSLIMDESSSIRKLLLEDQECNEILVHYNNTNIFKIAFDFINGKDLGEVRDLKTLFSLDAVAQKFGMEELNRTCVHMMIAAVSFQTVWKIYDKCRYRRVEESCEWLLSTRTQELLNCPKFLEIRPKTLNRFLKLKEMNIESETVLLEACRRFVGTELYGPAREVFRKYALPRLRVLNLSASDIYNLGSFLTPEEIDFLGSYWMRFSKKRASEVPGLCLEKRRRRPANARALVIEPDKDIYDKLDWSGNFIESPMQSNKFSLSFKTKKIVQLQRIVFFCPKRMHSSEDEFNNLPISGPSPPPYPEAIVELEITFKGKKDSIKPLQLNSSDMFLNRTASIKLNNILVPKSARVKIEIEMYGAFAFYEFDKSESTIFECSDPSIKKVLQEVELEHLHDGVGEQEKWNTTIFKSVHMKLI